MAWQLLFFMDEPKRELIGLIFYTKIRRKIK